jgi:6-phosphofructokinase 1
MNAAIRAVVRTALAHGWQAYGILSGFSGLLAGQLSLLEWRDVSGIIQRGGTVLRSARSEEFMLPAVQKQAIRNLRQHEIDALVVIGGEGSQRGAHALATAGFPVVGIPATIDNDLFGSDTALGVDSAVNVALEAVDRLKVTAASHSRVPGRGNGAKLRIPCPGRRYCWRSRGSRYS